MSRSFKQLTVFAVLLGLAGCTARTIIPVGELTDPPHSDSYFVTTRSGQEMEFVTLRAAGDTLEGTVRTVRQRVTGQGEGERVEVRNDYRDVFLPFGDVRSVEIRKSAPREIFLVAAGALAAGGLYFLLRKNNDAGGGG